MMLRNGWIGLIALLISASAHAGVKAQPCHLLEPGIYATLAQDAPKDENNRRNGGVGGTGIVAEISSTSPLRLSGCQVEIGANTEILDEQQRMSPDYLAKGQVVFATLKIHDGRLLAQSIVIHHVLEGVVDKQAAHNELEILGKQVILVPERTQMASRAGSALEGASVKVSGLRRPDGKIIASRIDVFDQLEASGTMGPLERKDSKYMIGGIEIAGEEKPEWLGHTVSVLGNWNGSRIEATEFELAGWRKDETPRWVLLEGYLGTDHNGNRIGLVPFSARSEPFLAQEKAGHGDLISVFGKLLSDGSLEVRQLWRQ